MIHKIILVIVFGAFIITAQDYEGDNYCDMHFANCTQAGCSNNISSCAQVIFLTNNNQMLSVTTFCDGIVLGSTQIVSRTFSTWPFQRICNVSKGFSSSKTTRPAQN